MRALIIAWITTLGLIAGLALWLQLSYEPPALPHTSPGEATALPPAPERPPEIVPEIVPETVPGSETETSPPSGLELPLGSLSEDGPYGPLPISSGGRHPWQAYGQEYTPADGTPWIAIVLTHFGQVSSNNTDLIAQLPNEVSYAFSPYGRNLQEATSDARSMGHEVLVMMPMEPRGYPAVNPGPHTLLASGPTEQNIDRLHFVLSRFENYVGLIVEMGSRFTSEAEAVRPIMADLSRRGILFLDTSPQSTSATRALASEYGVLQGNSDIFIDNIPSTNEIDSYLANLEQIARQRGSAIGVGRVSYAATIERVTFWAAGLQERNIRLVPVSAVLRRRNGN